MKISRKNDFQIHPATDDKIQAVIVDITPSKIAHTPWGDKLVFRIVYETECEMEDGKHFCLWSRQYTESIGEKSNFYHDLVRIIGRELSDAEADDFDTESLLYAPVLMIVEHEAGKDGQTYAVISYLCRDKSATPYVPTGDYVRVQDRPAATQPPNASSESAKEKSAAYHPAPKTAQPVGREDWQKCKVHVGKHSGVDLGDLQEEAVKALIDNWLPQHLANPKPKADDKRLAAALTIAAQIMAEPPEEKQDDLPY